MAKAHAIVQGTLCRATAPNPDAPDSEGVTDFVISRVIKPHRLVAPKETIVIPRHIEIPGGKGEYVAFADIVKDKIGLYYGLEIKPGSDLPKYVAGILKIKDRKPAQRLRFYFDHLHNADELIAQDALIEIQKADYKDLRAVAEKLPAEKLVAWLRDPRTRADHVGMYALLLGHCSKDRTRDAALLRTRLEGVSSSRDLVLTGLVLLQPREGWRYTSGILQDSSQEFMERYRALRTVRFLMQNRTDLVSAEELLRGILPSLDQEDFADLAIEEFRKWKRWELTERVLALRDRKWDNLSFIRRVLIRFALSNPTETAKRFVQEQRKADPEAVKHQEELLRLLQEQNK